MTGPTDTEPDSAHPNPESSRLEEIAEIAGLARLRPVDPGAIATQIERLLGHFVVLQEVDTEGVEPSAYPITIPHRTRPDVPEAPLPRDEVLKNAPASRGGCFLVPRVVEG